MSPEKIFTGRARAKRTRASVKLMDVVSRLLITIGGLGTLITVSTVFLFLLWVAAPLLSRARIENPHSYNVSGATGVSIIHMGLGEYRLMEWLLFADGRLQVRRMDDGEVLEEERLFPGREIKAFAAAGGYDEVIVGFDDGTVALGRIGFSTEFVDQTQASPELKVLGPGSRLRIGNGIAERISADQFRIRRLAHSFAEPIEAESPAAIRLIAYSITPLGKSYAALSEDGRLYAYNLSERKNILTGDVVLRRVRGEITDILQKDRGLPQFMVLSGLGDSLLVAWADGYAVRLNIRDLRNPVVEERLRMLDDPGLRLTVVQNLLGGTTILAGDSAGTVRAWFPVLTEYGVGQTAQRRLIAAHRFERPGAAVTALANSTRMRMFVAGYEDGGILLYHVTSHKLLGEVEMPGAASGAPVLKVALAPKDDMIFGLSSSLAAGWSLDPRYPEATLSSLFLPVWYEGARKPEHVWQSSSGTDDFEPKLGLMPLIFGTIKATVFSLLFGVPIALLGAVFTSEFMSPRSKARIKPIVEMMASLPSVVLGFLAALVFAPVAAKMLPAVLSVFVTVPLAFLFGSYLWQLIPHRVSLRIQRWRFPAMFAAIPFGLLAASGVGPWMEQYCFSGDIMRWLDGQVGGARGGWLILFFPLSILLVAWLMGFTEPWIRRISIGWSRSKCAVMDLVRFIASLAIAALLAFGAAVVATALGFDPRGGIFGTYVQRNALMVGFVMGFAVIPIIYTIAEDALSAVPEHLRSASLAAGATPWQTATRIIIPTAMSGLFSAIMIGLGRAVGETMIVLMAAGNTPVMEWNLFNGFRTLSANIAVELPEAVRNSTHYRTLFLAALTLFAMTFVLNTAAEMVRLRFRRKAVEL